MDDRPSVTPWAIMGMGIVEEEEERKREVEGSREGKDGLVQVWNVNQRWFACYLLSGRSPATDETSPIQLSFSFNFMEYHTQPCPTSKKKEKTTSSH